MSADGDRPLDLLRRVSSRSSTDLCATDPEQAARRLVEGGFALHDETALQTLTDLPYNLWRELDPKAVLRPLATRVRHAQLDPNKIIAEGTDWRFLSEIKRELKA
jgi:NitT/TauT family transport system substrate-binding protein